MSVELQSFVVAAIVAALFLAERIGGADQVSRHLYQVALGFALAFVVVSATTAFFRSDSQSFADIIAGDTGDAASELFNNDSGNAAREGAAVRAGIGIVLLLAGFASISRLSTLPLGVAFGGLLLLFSGGGVSAAFDINSLSANAIFGSLFGQAGEGRDIAHFIVMLVGTLILLGFGYWRWESPGAPQSPPQPAV